MGRPDPFLLEPLSHALRENAWEVDALVQENGAEDNAVPSSVHVARVLALLPPGRGQAYGFAIDLGTTTVDVALHDLESGRQVARRALLNRQAAFGADVISRAQAFAADRVAVREAAAESIREGARAILARGRAFRRRRWCAPCWWATRS